MKDKINKRIWTHSSLKFLLKNNSENYLISYKLRNQFQNWNKNIILAKLTNLFQLKLIFKMSLKTR